MNEETARKLGEVVGAIIVIVILGVAVAFVAWLAANILQFIGFAFIGWILAGVLTIALYNSAKKLAQKSDDE